jgi:hypothetical protein
LLIYFITFFSWSCGVFSLNYVVYLQNYYSALAGIQMDDSQAQKNTMFVVLPAQKLPCTFALPLKNTRRNNEVHLQHMERCSRQATVLWQGGRGSYAYT